MTCVLACTCAHTYNKRISILKKEHRGKHRGKKDNTSADHQRTHSERLTLSLVCSGLSQAVLPLSLYNAPDLDRCALGAHGCRTQLWFIQSRWKFPSGSIRSVSVTSKLNQQLQTFCTFAWEKIKNRDRGIPEDLQQVYPKDIPTPWVFICLKQEKK